MADLQERLLDLLPEDMPIWADDDELSAFRDRGYRWWMAQLGHERLHSACCTSCGCCITCMAGAFYDAVVASVVRELDKLGALQEPGGRRG